MAARKRAAPPKTPKKLAPNEFTLILMQGVEGPSVYLNNFRIAGPKPWGGGKVIREWTVSREDVETALAQPKLE